MSRATVPRARASGGTLAVNDLPLPPALAEAIADGRWRVPSRAMLERVFRERPTAPAFHDVAAMRTVNHRWRNETDATYLGRSDSQSPPGDLDPARSLIVGELGPELLIALDYRTDADDPSVVYLHSGGDQWITVATGVRKLLSRLGLDTMRGARSG